ncbi:MAG TPA: hypothetical protein VLC48_04145, partial [Gemmatimonadota bacterium]|nr:hypothetical protein [Gemmatimonadota bacterium]
MKRSIVIFVALLVVASGLVAALTFAVYGYPLVTGALEAWIGVLALMALTVLAEGLGVRVTGPALFSVSLIPIVATVPLFGPSVAVASTAGSQVIARFFLQKQHPVKSTFNVAQLTLAVGFGSMVY